jgi:PHP domain
MHEVVANLHSHTVYSDGEATHDEVAAAAIRAGLDVVWITDHNVYAQGLDGYRYLQGRRVLLLVGEEIHDQTRVPQKDHLIVLEAGRELASLATRPQQLLDAVHQAGGLAFLAHIVDPAAPLFHQGDLSWVEDTLRGPFGVEIWNTMSEFKGHLRSVPSAFWHAYFPDFSPVGPYPDALARWDAMLAAGKRVPAIGGADAHGMKIHLGPLRLTLFPYEFMFRAVNTHILVQEPLSGDADADRARLAEALRRGRCFVGYSRPASPRGFRFTAHSDRGEATLGDSLACRLGATLQVHLPRPAEITLIRHGTVVRRWASAESAVQLVTEPGAYRVEARLPFRGRLRHWIVSSPIYLTAD